MGADPGDALQQVPEVVHRPLDLRHALRVVPQLHPAHGRAHLVHAVLEAPQGEPGEGAQVLRLDGQGGGGGAEALVVAEGQGPLEDLPAVRGQHPPLAGREALVGHQGGGADVPDGAHGAPLVQPAVGVGDVLDHLHPAPAGDLHDGAHVRRVAEVVHGDDGPGALGDAVLDVGGVEAEGVGVDVGEDDGGPEAEGGEGGGPVGDAGADDLVAHAHPAGEHRRLEGGGAAGVGQGVAGALPGGVLGLELARHVQGGHGPPVEDVQHRRFVFRGDDGPGKHVAGPVRDGLRATVDCQA